MSRIAVLLLFAGCGPAAPVSDAETLLGEWAVVDFHAPGGAEDRSQFRNRARVSAETWSQQFNEGLYEDFEYTIDPTRAPKHLDLTYTDPRGKRLTVRAIYEIAGDELRVCMGSPPVVVSPAGTARYAESRRPSAFEAKDGALMVFHRAKK